MKVFKSEHYIAGHGLTACFTKDLIQPADILNPVYLPLFYPLFFVPLGSMCCGALWWSRPP